MPEEPQLVFTVSDVASIFSVSEETVRRWIRSGKLKASIDSKKDGHKITESAVREFVSTKKPKYQKLLPLMGLSPVQPGFAGTALLASPIITPMLGVMSAMLLNEFLRNTPQEQNSDIHDGGAKHDA